ncbi:MAG: hypothetical protein M1825_005334 [Sarcosagium campestre]|nr:MAG: hypothetical protein M1825_005334 [Sarcosagium campestre]
MARSHSISWESRLRPDSGTDAASLASARSSSIGGDFSFPKNFLGEIGSSPPTRASSVVFQDGMPRWAVEAGLSLNSNRSPASSIISTRTRTSVFTSPPDESSEGFDVQLGQGAVFRLGLDGRILNISKVGDTSDGADEFLSRRQSTVHEAFARRGAESDRDNVSDPQDFGNLAHHEAQIGNPSQNENPPGLTSESLNASQPMARPENSRSKSSTESGVLRSPSFKPGKDNITVHRPRHDANSVSPRPTSQDPVADATSQRLRRRGGMKLKVVTRSPNGQPLSPVSYSTLSAGSYTTLGSGLQSANAPIDDEQVPSSPAFIGKDATGVFPSTRSSPEEIALPVAGISGTRSPIVTHRHRHDETHDISLTPSPLQHGDESNAGSDDSGIGLAADESYPAVTVDDQRAYVDETCIGSRPPPPMDGENDVSIHYSRLVRSMDSNHRLELSEKDQEIEEQRKMIQALSKETYELKAELIRTKSSLKAMADPSHIRNLAREDTVEAQSFSFPPLKLSHIRTLKTAVKKRAQKIRALSDVNTYDPTVQGGVPSSNAAAATTTSAQSSPQAPASGPDSGSGGSQKFRLPQLGRDGQVISPEIPFWENAPAIDDQLAKLRVATFWMDRCERLEKQRNDALLLAKGSKTSIAAHIRREVDETWRARWGKREEELARSLGSRADEKRRLEHDIAQRDEWASEWGKKNSELCAELGEKCDEILALKHKLLWSVVPT